MIYENKTLWRLDKTLWSRYDFPGVDHEGRQTCRWLDFINVMNASLDIPEEG